MYSWRYTSTDSSNSKVTAMKHWSLLSCTLLAATACAFQSSTQRVDGAPSLPPSASAIMIAEAPPGAIALGTVTVQGNNFKAGPECEAQALFEAKKLGATHVIVDLPIPHSAEG